MEKALACASAFFTQYPNVCISERAVGDDLPGVPRDQFRNRITKNQVIRLGFSHYFGAYSLIIIISAYINPRNSRTAQG